jgi:leader peptidase (prepilin peptidase)/N-methyltransferase
MRILDSIAPAPSAAVAVVAVPVVYLALATVPLAVGDIRSRRLSNRLVLPGYALLALVLLGTVLFAAELHRVVFAAAVCVSVVVGSWALAARGVVGMGDVKLAGLLAGTLGLIDPVLLSRSAVIAVTTGGAWAIAVVLRARARGDPWRRCTVPFGVPLLVGFWSGIAQVW